MGTAAVVALAGCEPGPVVPRWLRHLFSRKLSVSAMPPCIVRPEQTEGPYFVDERLNRSDIRSDPSDGSRSEEHTSELQSQSNLVCRLLLEKKKKTTHTP